MMLQLLIPAVENAEEADLSTEMFRVGGDFDQRLGAAAEEQSVEQGFVLQSQRRQLMRERKDNMSIGRRQKFGASCGQPTIARLVLALRAVPIATGVIRDGSMAAGRALVQMAAQCHGTASLDGNQDLQVKPCEPRRRMIPEPVSRGGYDIGQLQEWPRHLLPAMGALRGRGHRKMEGVERAGGGFEMPFGKM